MLKIILESDFLQVFLLLVRIFTPIVALFVVWRSFTSFRKGLRPNVPVVVLEHHLTKTIFPVLYWENSIGRSKSCDIVIDNPTVSRDHAVLLRRRSGWYVVDTDSKSGVAVNRQKVEGRTLVEIGDRISIGKMTLTLKNAKKDQNNQTPLFTGFMKKAASKFSLVFLTSVVHCSMAFQLAIGTGKLNFEPVVLLFFLTLVGWTFYFTSTRLLKRRTFEVETIAFLMSGIGILLLSSQGLKFVTTQFAAMLAGMILYMLLIAFMSNVDKVTEWQWMFTTFALLFFVVNMFIGEEINGSKNWIFIGPVSIQPSEIIKMAFVMVSASTLDKLQTKRNIGLFIAFSGVCMGFLFIMRDFGTALVFFVAFLITAFMRSGSARTIILILTVAILGACMIISFMPYVAQRFAGWGNIWNHINDSLGYQQTRTLTYIASGGMFGMGLGRGYLHYIAAAESDLVFGWLCEEQGLLMGFVVVSAIVIFMFMALDCAKRSRSAFYSITSCGAVGIFAFQACLNIFGSTDVLPLTGVTLPFISLGGSSMLSVWGLLAFLKSADERTYGLKRISKTVKGDSKVK